jgi:hypothetical protein
MAKSTLILSLFLLVSFTSAFSQTLDQIIDNYLSARGQSVFNELQTMIVKGEKVYPNGDLKSDFAEYIKYPGKFREDTFWEGLKHSVLYNNGKGGIINPYSGNIVKESFADISVDRIRAMESSDIQGLLYNWKEKCKQVISKGKTTINGIEMFRIRIITNTSDTLDYYIDTKDYLLKQVACFPDNPDPTVYTYDKYRNVNGMQLPFEILNSNSSGWLVKETIREYLFNEAVADSLFEFK